MLVGGGRPARAGAPPRRDDSSQPAPTASALRARSGRRARQLDSARRACCSPSSSDRAAEGGFELIAGERRWRAARSAGIATLPASCATSATATRCCSGWSRTSPASNSHRLKRREPTPLSSTSSSSRSATWRIGSEVEAGRVQPAAAARVARGGALDARARGHERGPCTRGAVASRRRRRRRLARRIVKEGLTVRAAERAAREGGAKRRPRRVAAVDPALVDRARERRSDHGDARTRQLRHARRFASTTKRGSKSSSKHSKLQRSASPRIARLEEPLARRA